MALQKDIPLAGGITATAAYARIFSLTFERRGNTILASVLVAVYKDRPSRLADPEGAIAHMVEIAAEGPAVLGILNGANTIDAIYTYLKTRPEFAGATDVLE